MMSTMRRKRTSDRFANYRVDTSESENRGKHAEVFPVKPFFLLRFDECLSETIRDVFSCIHSCLYAEDHGTINLNKIIMEFRSPGLRAGWYPLKGFDKVYDV